MFARLIKASETIPLRQAVLRKGMPTEASAFLGDDDATTFHVGASDITDGQPLAVATMMLQDDPRCDAESESGVRYRLRGMAVAESRQRTGLGSTALVFAEQEAVQRGATIVWCNARVAALPFYLKHGYETVGELFDIPTVGPHFFCRKRLDT